jgi:C2 domain
MNAKINGNVPIKFNSFQLTICGSRELKCFNGTKAMNPYCLLLFDDIKYAKTREKTSDNASWDETFTLAYG